LESRPVEVIGSRGVQTGDHGVQHNHFYPVRPITWPHRVGVVPPLADCRQDRAADRLLIEANGTLVVCQVVTGGGGVGKTQLAAYLADGCWRNGSVDLLVWVSATSRAAVTDTYAQVARDVTGAERADAPRLLNWLATTERRWLIVLDDLSDPANLSGLWPPDSPHGRTVVTTRRLDSALTTGRQVIEVGLFTPAEAGEYLRLKLGEDVGLLAGADDLAGDLGHLPLALAQAAAYMLDRRLSCTQYRVRFADRRRRLTELVPEHGALPDAQVEPVDATWSLSMELADQLRPSGLAGPMLRLLSLLDGNGCPAQLMTQPVVLKYLDGMQPEAAGRRTVDTDDARDTMTNLHRLSLATLDGDSLRVHALTQRVVRESIHTDGWKDLTGIAAAALIESGPRIEADQRFAQVLRANVAALDEHTDGLLWETFPGLLCEAGTSFGRVGRAAEAANYFTRMLPIAAKHLEADSPHLLIIRSSTARWQEDPADAAAAYEEVLPDLARILGRDHRETLVARSNHARSLGEAGRLLEAVAAYDELIPELVSALGPAHPDTLIARSVAIAMRGDLGDPVVAVAAFEQLLTERVQCAAEDESGILVTRRILAEWRAIAGDEAGAKADLHELIPKLRSFFGPDHPDTLAARKTMVLSQMMLGQAAGLADAIDELSADHIRVFGRENRAWVELRLHLVRLLESEGEEAGAAAVRVKLLPVLVSILGGEHRETLSARVNIALYRASVGLADSAVASLRKVIPVLTKALGPDDIDTLTTRAALAFCHGEAGQPRVAAALYADVVDDFERLFGSTDERTLQVWHSFGHWLGKAGEKAGAVEVYRLISPRCAAALGRDHPHSLNVRASLACWQAECGEVTNAVAALKEVLATQERVLGSDHPQTVATRTNLGHWRRARTGPGR
jgi:hypothetical protein